MLVISFLLGITAALESNFRGINPLVETLRPETEAKDLRNLLNINHSQLLSYPILYTFPKKMMCFSVITDGSLYGKTISSLLYENDLTPSILNMAHGEHLNCRGYVSATSDMGGLKKHIVELKRDAKSRILCYVKTGNEKEIEDILQNELEIFGDAEFTIFVWELKDFFYRVGQPNRTAEKIMYDESTGRWQLRKGVINNFYGQKMKITAGNCTIFSHVGDVNSDGTAEYFVGIDAFILKEILGKLNMTYTLVKPAPGNLMSNFINGSWIGGMFENLEKKKSDIAACGALIERHKTSGGLQLSIPISPICITYLVRIELLNTRWLLIFQSFDASTWIILCVTATVFSGIVTVFSEAMSHSEAFNMSDRRYRSFLYSSYKTFGTLMGNDWPSFKEQLGPIRQLFTGWIFFSVLMTCAYSSTLISHLTNPVYASKPKEIQDLVDGGYLWTTEQAFATERLLDLDNPIFRTWANRHRRVTHEQRLKALSTDSKQIIVGFVMQKGLFFPYSTYSSELPANLTDNFEIMDTCIASLFHGFVLRGGTPYLDSINHYISMFQGNGLLEHFSKQTSYVKQLPKPTHVEKRTKSRCKTEACESRKLKVEQLEGVFLLLLVGWIISGCAFGGELMAHRLKKRKQRTNRQLRSLKTFRQ